MTSIMYMNITEMDIDTGHSMHFEIHFFPGTSYCLYEYYTYN